MNTSGITEICENWFSVGTPDYYNKCSRGGKTGVPRNSMGYQESKEGMGYIGLITGVSFADCVSEFVQGVLKEQLLNDSLYCVSFYYSLAEGATYYADGIGVIFNEKKFNYKEKIISKYGSDALIDSGFGLKNFKNWQQFCKRYRANGSENYITIGNFYCNNNQNISYWVNKESKFNGYFKNESYYFIDEVSVKKISKSDDCICEGEEVKKDIIQEQVFYKEKIITLPDFTFETGKWIIAEDKVPLLDSLADYLKLNKKAEIVIEGYTDNIGKEEENQLLSEKRAESVMEYLLNIGIGESRITTIGFGSQHPVSSNSTAVGRSKNRRVEIKIE